MKEDLTKKRNSNRNTIGESSSKTQRVSDTVFKGGRSRKSRKGRKSRKSRKGRKGRK